MDSTCSMGTLWLNAGLDSQKALMVSRQGFLHGKASKERRQRHAVYRTG